MSLGQKFIWIETVLKIDEVGDRQGVKPKFAAVLRVAE